MHIPRVSELAAYIVVTLRLGASVTRDITKEIQRAGHRARYRVDVVARLYIPWTLRAKEVKEQFRYPNTPVCYAGLFAQ